MEYLALGLAVFLGGIVCGFAGFAFSAVAGAILLHFMEPMLAIPLMMLCSIASQITSLAALRRVIAWREATPLLAGAAIGVPLALHVITALDPETFRLAFGLFLAAYALYMLARPAAAVIGDVGAPLAHSAVGFAGGFVGGLTAMPGALPAIWCDLRGVSRSRQRSVVQPFIVIVQAFAIALYLSRPDAAHRELFANLAFAAPALTAGTLIGVWLFGRINDAVFRACVLLLLLVSGALMAIGVAGPAWSR